MSSKKEALSNSFQTRLKAVFRHVYGKEWGAQRKLAQATGLGSGTISEWLREVNPTTPDNNSIGRISDVLGISFEWLATGKGAMLPEGDVVKEPGASYGRPAMRPSNWRAAVERVDAALVSRGLARAATDAQKDLLVELLAQGEAAGAAPEELQRQLVQLVDLVEASIRKAREGRNPNP